MLLLFMMMSKFKHTKLFLDLKSILQCSQKYTRNRVSVFLKRKDVRNKYFIKNQSACSFLCYPCLGEWATTRTPCYSRDLQMIFAEYFCITVHCACFSSTQAEASAEARNWLILKIHMKTILFLKVRMKAILYLKVRMKAIYFWKSAWRQFYFWKSAWRQFIFWKSTLRQFLSLFAHSQILR